MASGMNSAQACPQCGATVFGNASRCPQCGLMRVASSRTSQPSRPWGRGDLIEATVWAVSIVAATALWYQWLVAQVPQSGEATWGNFFAIVVAPLVGLTVGLGVVGGAVIRTDGPKVELLTLACVGAGCMVFTVSGIASSDPTQCDPNSGCDLSYGFGAVLGFPFVLVPFLAGTAIGRGFSALMRRRGV